MTAAGIITEYDPLHMGHVHLMRQARCQLGPDAAVVCVMSGNYVQRGGFAIVNKWARAAAAVQSGADLVLELPVPWALSSAEGFAAGAAEILKAAGVVTHLIFGSESGDTEALVRLADALCSDEFTQILRRELSRGDSFPAARQRAVGSLLSPEEAALLSNPNDILGVEYCKALRHSGIQPIAVPRLGSAHGDEAAGEGGIVSSSAIRALLRSGDEEAALDLMAPAMAEAYRAEKAAGRAPVLLERCERAVLARLRFMEEEDFAALDLGREGLYHRFCRASRSAASVEELLRAVKTKRYPLARLRRMVFRAYLGLPPAPPPAPPYLRLLAANQRGTALLARMRRAASLPVLTKPASVRRMGRPAQRLFELEARAGRLYALAYPAPAAAVDEWCAGPVIRREEGGIKNLHP